MNLLDAIAKSVGTEYAATTKSAGLLASVKSDAIAFSKPVFQFNRFPIALDANDYNNPRSDSNPRGDLRSLNAFRQLVDPVPGFSHYYSPSSRSTEDTYGSIVEGLSISSVSPFASKVISDAKEQFEQGGFANMDGIPGQWRPVYAVPEYWWDVSQSSLYKDLDFDLSDQGGPDGPFTLLGGSSDLRLSVDGGRASSASLDPSTKIKSLKMKYLFVQFRRRWLNSALFDLSGWRLSGQPQGWCSSGKTDDNPGVMALLPTGMLLAKDISIEAEWGRDDQAFLASAEASRQSVSIGPLALQAQSSSSSLQVIGWTSFLVPYSPKESDLRPGSILVKNNGAFVCRFSVSWQQNGRPTTNESGIFPVLAAKSVSIPAAAGNISIKLEIMTFPSPFETWKTVATYEFEAPVRKCFELSGETWSAISKEVNCTE